MTKKKKSGSAGFKNFMERTVTIPFSDVSEIKLPAGVGYTVTEFDLKAATFATTTRLGRLMTMYEFFRFKKLWVEAVGDFNPTGFSNIVSGTSNDNFPAGVAHGVGFIPSENIDFGIVTNFHDLMQFPNSCMDILNRKVVLNIKAQDLYGSTPTKWYHTSTTGSPPLADSSAGTITYVTRRAVASTATATSYSYLIMRGLVEFKAPIFPGESFSSSGVPTEDVIVVEEEKVYAPPPSVRSSALRIDTNPNKLRQTIHLT